MTTMFAVEETANPKPALAQFSDWIREQAGAAGR